MLSFALQCCDSEFYLRLAAVCAEQGECYDELRPMGAQYWFSLPLRMGLAQEYSIAGHWLLLLCSALLFVLAVRHILAAYSTVRSPIVTALLGVAAVALHSIVFWPVMFVALADAVAGLLCLIGMWFYILSRQRDHLAQSLMIFLAGLMLGLAVWMRSFYLYPVLAIIVLYMVAWLLNRNRRVGELLLLSALLPILFQYQATYSRYGEWAYISPSQTNTMFVEHFNSDVSGYDTLVPGRPHRYFPSCAYSGGWISGLIHGDIAGMFCLLTSRVEFYFASDLRSVYIDQRASNNLFKYGENLDVAGQWRLSKGLIKANTDISPDGSRNAETLIASPDEGFEVETPVIPQQDGIYTWSLWLWAKQDMTISLGWFNAWAKQYDFQQTITITPEPVRYVFSGELKHAVYFLSLVVKPSGHADEFHAWGLQIEPGAVETGYQFHSDVHQQRHYSMAYAAANGLIFLLAIYALRRYASAGLILPSVLAGLLIAQALIILPEQRFIVAAQTYMACLALLGIWPLLCLKRCARRKADA